MPLARRSCQVAVTFSGQLLHWRRPLPQRLRLACGQLGPIFVKLGQLIASSPGMLPPSWTEEFASLREQVPPFPVAEVRRIVETELSAPLDRLFAEFEEVPLAAASIAQVHGARLPDGQRVVVKVQRPNLDALVRDDLRAMHWLAELAERIPYSAIASPRAVVEDFTRTLHEEMDFRLEADNMERMRAILVDEGITDVVVPRVQLELVTRRVLTMERIDGIRFDDVASMHAAGIDTFRLLRRGIQTLIEGVVIHGFFHGDLHAGNIRVLADGSFVMLDFGIVGRLTESVRTRLAQYLVSVTANDYPGIVRALRSFGDAVPPGADLDLLAREVQHRYEPFVKDGVLLAELGDLLVTLVRSMVEFRIRIPRELVLLSKQLLYLEAAAKTLAPDMDLLHEQQLICASLIQKYPTLGRQMLDALNRSPSDRSGDKNGRSGTRTSQ